MKAIRVRKKGKGERYAAHFLVDDELTRCGLNVDKLNVVEDLDVQELSPIEGCVNCVRFTQGWEKPKPTVESSPFGYALPASRGRISKVGKLRSSGQSGHGNLLR